MEDKQLEFNSIIIQFILHLNCNILLVYLLRLKHNHQVRGYVSPSILNSDVIKLILAADWELSIMNGKENCKGLQSCETSKKQKKKRNY